MIRISFLIRSLELGGAERQLVELVKRLDKKQFAVNVITFYDGGVLQPEIEKIDGVKLYSLKRQGRWDLLPFLLRLGGIMVEVKPDIIHGYMGVANELSLLWGKVVGAKVIWGLRASHVDFSYYDKLSGSIFCVGAWFSRFADLIILNSWAGKKHYIAHGYYSKRMKVISNGIDAGCFYPDPKAGQRVRAEWGIKKDERVIGLVGRLDPMKDHATFLRAAALIASEQLDVRFVCVGDGAESYKNDMLALGEALHLERHLIWAGVRNDMLAVYNAFDIAVSCSSGEGFSNAVGEAMACGIPCVVTDVGDTAMIVGDTGVVVPSQNAPLLAEAWRRVLRLSDEERTMLGAKAREHIINEFDIQTTVAKCEAVFIDLLDKKKWVSVNS